MSKTENTPKLSQLGSFSKPENPEKNPQTERFYELNGRMPENAIEHLSFMQSKRVKLNCDQWDSTELEMYQSLLHHQDIKIKKMERLLSQLQAELEDNARFRLSWMSGANPDHPSNHAEF